jgi:hypothetical protein
MLLLASRVFRASTPESESRMLAHHPFAFRCKSRLFIPLNYKSQQLPGKRCCSLKDAQQSRRRFLAPFKNFALFTNKSYSPRLTAARLAYSIVALQNFSAEVKAMSTDETTATDDKRRRQVYIDDEDIAVRLLGLAEGTYECVNVDTPWLERGFLEGDVILFNSETEAEDGDIVLIEEEGETRLGVASAPGYLLTKYGPRMLDPTEYIVGVGLGLVRRLRREQE